MAERRKHVPRDHALGRRPHQFRRRVVDPGPERHPADPGNLCRVLLSGGSADDGRRLGRADGRRAFRPPDGYSEAGIAEAGIAAGTCGCVPLMNASVAPESSVTNTMLPGASNSGGIFRSPRFSMYSRMKSIQIGSAAVAPVSPLLDPPIGFFSSYPTQTPTVMFGSNPMNHVSV